MNNLGLFFQFGIRMQGGPAFLKRTRTAFGQPQTRTRTGSTSNQLQTRTRTCLLQNTPVQWRRVAHIGCMTSNAFGYPPCPSPGGGCSNGTRIAACYVNFSSFCSGSSHVAIQDFVCDSLSFYAYSGFSGWSATGSCSATCPACWNANSVGLICRECQTVNVCSFSNYTGWSNVSSCTVASPGCSNGVVQRQCQTIYSFREQDWSAYEEVDVCVVASPAAGLNAVQVECVPQ